MRSPSLSISIMMEPVHRELEQNVKAMLFAGFLPPGERLISAKNIAWFAFTSIQFCVMFVLVSVKFACTEFSLAMGTSLAIQGVNAFQTLYRRLFFSYKLKKITALMESIDAVTRSESVEFDTLERSMREISTKHISRFSKLVYGFNTFVVLATVLLAVFGNYFYGGDCTNPYDFVCQSHSLFFNIWLGFDVRRSSWYYFIIAWQFASVVTIYSTIASSDAFACGLMLAVAERGALLARAAPQALLPAPKLTPHFRSYIKYHQHYLSLLKNLNVLMGPVVFMTYLVAGVSIISLSYLSVQLTDLSLVVVCLSSLVVVLVQLYVYAYAGQQITSNSEEIARSTLSAAQVAKGGLKDGPSRSALLVLVTRLSGGAKPEEMDGLGYFSLSIELFTKVLSASASYLLVLLQLQ